MQSANLLEGGSGGGGLYGNDRDVVLSNFRFEEHALEKKDKATGAVTERFATGCFFAVDIAVIDRQEDEPESATQYYSVGDLPLARVQALGELDKRRKEAGPGGYSPSHDNENASESGPFVVLEQRSDIWKDCAYMQFVEELKQLGLMEHAERITAQGVAALNGTRVHLGEKAMPKGKKAQADEKLTGQAKAARTILVPTQILSWGWEEQAAQSKPATSKAAAPKAAAPKAAAATTAAPAPAGGNGVVATEDLEGALVEALQGVIARAGGTIAKRDVPARLLPALSKHGANRPSMIKRADSDAFLESYNGAAWWFDAAEGRLTAL